MPKNLKDTIDEDEKKKKPRAGLDEVVKTADSKVADRDSSAGGMKLEQSATEKAPGIIPGFTQGVFASPQTNYGQYGPEQQGRTTAYYAGQTLGQFIRNRGLGLSGTPAQSAQYAAQVPGTPQYTTALESAVMEAEAKRQASGQLSAEQWQGLSTDIGQSGALIEAALNDPDFLRQYNIDKNSSEARDAIKEILAAHLIQKYSAVRESNRIRNALGLKSSAISDLATALGGMQ